MLPDDFFDSDFAISYNSDVEMQDLPAGPPNETKEAKKTRLKKAKRDRLRALETHFGRGQVPQNAWDRVTPSVLSNLVSSLLLFIRKQNTYLNKGQGYQRLA